MSDSRGRFVWYELVTTDVESAKAFYASVVGWGARAAVGGSLYTLFTAGDTAVAGLMKLPAEAAKASAPSQWIGYVAVDDVDLAAGCVKKLGGNVYIPPTDVPNVSRFSIISDPQMATLALIKRREASDARSARARKPGNVEWHELLASDLETAFAFYSALFGWQKSEAHTGSMGTYQQFSAGGETIGGMFARPEMSPMSMWLHYFSAGDIEAAVKRVITAGGQIFYGPVAVPGGARIVHCMDPQGAVFALIEWRVRVAVACYPPRTISRRAGR
ncbi:MAG: VOC family protein [Rhodomicrobium sp.]